MNVLLLSKYSRNGASSRVRSLQYLPALRARGITVDVLPLFPESYLHALYGGLTLRRTWILVRSYVARVLALTSTRARYDAVWMEKELLPWIPYAAERLLPPKRIPLLVDYDDAIFAKYEQASSFVIKTLLRSKIRRIVGSAAVVVAGSEYLADALRQRGAKDVVVIPSSVDLAKYPEEPIIANGGMFRVGWIGSPSSAQYLVDLRAPLERLTADGDTILVVIGAKNLPLGSTRTEYLDWSEETEAESLSRIDVGIMPLQETAWSAGKCGYKLVQYMAAWKPVIASPVGANRAIVRHEHNGFLASSADEWSRYLSSLKTDLSLRRRLGIAGRRQVEAAYSVESNVRRLEEALRAATQRV